MLFFLRNSKEKNDLTKLEDGSVLLEDLLRHNSMQKLGMSFESVESIVYSQMKMEEKLFELKRVNELWFIKALKDHDTAVEQTMKRPDPDDMKLNIKSLDP